MEHSIKIRVRYCETDQMGVVYHGNYAIYYDTARVEMLRAHGLSYKEIENNGIALMVSKIEMKYLASAKYDDNLTVHVSIKKKPDMRMSVKGRITNEHGQLLNISTVTLIFYDINDKCVTAMPSFIAEAFKGHLPETVG